MTNLACTFAEDEDGDETETILEVKMGNVDVVLHDADDVTILVGPYMVSVSSYGVLEIWNGGGRDLYLKKPISEF